MGTSPRASDAACPDCEGPGWSWWPTGGVWVACATCNDDGARPEPTGEVATLLTREALVYTWCYAPEWRADAVRLDGEDVTWVCFGVLFCGEHPVAVEMCAAPGEKPYGLRRAHAHAGACRRVVRVGRIEVEGFAQRGAGWKEVLLEPAEWGEHAD